MSAMYKAAQETWGELLDDITLRQAGQFVRLEQFGKRREGCTEAWGMPLRSISYGGKGGDMGTVEILLGTEPEDHITHRITAPVDIRVQYGGAGKDGGWGAVTSIEIAAADEPTTLLAFL